MSTAKRNIHLDLVRILACILVVLMHSPMAGNNGLSQSVVSLLTAPCIGLFFMTSGALLLPAREGMFPFMKKRLSKVLVPTLFWTLFYIAANIVIGKTTFSELPKQILSVPFSPQGYGTLWFMYVLIGLYLLTPVISPWLEKASKKEIKFILILWGVTLLYPFLKMWLTVDSSETGPLYYLTGYAGYFLLGYYLNKYKPKIGSLLLILFLILPFALAVATKKFGWKVNFYEVFWYLSILTVLTAIFWFYVLKKPASWINSESRFGRFIISLSNLTFGIYLCHIFIIRYCLAGFMEGSLTQIIVTFLIAFVVSALFCYLVSLLPIGKWMIGYSRKR